MKNMNKEIKSKCLAEDILKLNEIDFKLIRKYGDILSWFMVSSNQDYLYNESYISEYYKIFENFTNNIKSRELYIEKYIELLLEDIGEFYKIIIEFDEYIKYEIAYLEKIEQSYENIIPKVLLNNETDKIYINCKIQRPSGKVESYITESCIKYKELSFNRIIDIDSIVEDIKELLNKKGDTNG